MNVKTTIVLALALIVGIGAYLILKPAAPAAKQEAAQKTEKQTKPLYELSQLVKFEVERPGKGKIVFTKPLKPGKEDQYADWELLEPIKAKSSNWEVNSFADKFKALKYKEEFTPGKGGFPAADKIGLAPPKAVVSVTDSKGAAKKIDVGDRVFGGEETYVRLAGKDNAYIAELDVREDLKKDANKFRSKDLFDFDKAKAVQVDVTTDGKKVVLLKGAGDAWVIDQPVKAPADKSKIDSLLSDIRYLRADDFIDDAPKSLTAFGLDKPKTTVSVTIEEKIEEKKKEQPTTTQATQPAEPKIKRTTYTVLIGGASDLKGDKLYCKLGDEPWVVSVTKSSCDKLQPKLNEWRSAKVVEAKVLDADKIDLTVTGAHLTLEKKSGIWSITSPKPGKAEQSAVKDLLSALNDLKATDWVDQPKDKKSYGLEKPQAEIVLSIKGQTTAERILVGGNTESGLLTYVNDAASPSIAVVKLDAAKKLEAPTLAYCDRSVMHFAKARAEKIDVARKNVTVVLSKQKGTWKMTQPVSGNADADAVNDLLGSLASLKATQIVGEGELAKFGLDKPELKVTVTVKPPEPPKPTTTRATTAPTTTAAATAPASRPVGAPRTAASTKPAATKPAVRVVHVLLVTKKDGKIYAALPGSRMVYELGKSVYDNLTAEMHDRKPIAFDKDKVSSVEVLGGEKPLNFARKDAAWSYVPDPHLRIDKQKVDDLLKALSDLKVERYVTYAAKDLKPYGLDKPDLTVTITPEGKPAITMLLSKPDKDGKRHATLKAEPGKMMVFIVGKADVTKFAKKLSDFVKS
jgi:hypothetical protein